MADQVIHSLPSELNTNMHKLIPHDLYRPFSEGNKTENFTYTIEHTGTIYLLFISTTRAYCTINWNGSDIGGVALPTSADPMAITVPIRVKKGDTISVTNLSATCYVSNRTALIADWYEPVN